MTDYCFRRMIQDTEWRIIQFRLSMDTSPKSRPGRNSFIGHENEMINKHGWVFIVSRKRKNVRWAGKFVSNAWYVISFRHNKTLLEVLDIVLLKHDKVLKS